MVRTQVLLDEEMYKQIKLKAFLNGKSFAATVRQLLSESLNGEGHKRRPRKKPLSSKDFSFIGSAIIGKRDNIGERHDEELNKGRRW
jgi:plasmid stability protein